MTTKLYRPVLALVLSVAGVAALAACTSSSTSTAKSSDSSTASTSTAAALKAGNVTITAAKGCELDHSTFAAGGITFKVSNQDAPAVSEVELLSGERILGEKENIPPGLGGQFAVRVGAGKYTLYCPGATVEKSTITVTGKAIPTSNDVAVLIKQGTADYKQYVDAQIGYLVTATGKLNAALQGTDLKAAQLAYIAARPYYEKVEPVAESFVNGKQNLDSDIDARVNDVPKGKWYGYHRIEKGLFQDKSLAGLKSFGTKLVKDVNTLQVKAKTLTYQGPDLANGAQSLLDEVASGKITGEEERYSHIDIVDMANNVEGSEQAFADLEPALKKIDAVLTNSISSAFAALDTVVAKYRSTSNSSGYVLYTALTNADRVALSAAVKAVAEPLSTVGSKIASA